MNNPFEGGKQTLATQNEQPLQESRAESPNRPTEVKSEVKKPFVEPEISVPIDVLEATTFFQAATSGVTN